MRTNFQNTNELKSAIASQTVRHLEIATPQLAAVNATHFRFVGSGPTFTIDRLGIAYLNYRLHNHLAIIAEKAEQLHDSETRKVYNEAMAQTFDKGAVAAIVDDQLVALMDADYVGLSHTELFDRVNELSSINSWDIVGGTLTTESLSIYVKVHTVSDFSIRLKIENGVAGTVAFGYRVIFTNEYGEPGQWEVKAPKALRTRHFNRVSENLDEALEHLGEIMDTVSEEAYLSLLNHIMIERTSIEVRTDREREALDVAFGTNQSVSLLDLMSELSVLSQHRGFKTASVALMNRAMKTVN